MRDRTVLIEHPFRAGYHLVDPDRDPVRTRECYRFEVPLSAGQTIKHRVIEERPIDAQVALTSADDPTLLYYVQSQAGSAKIREALQRAGEWKSKLTATRHEIALLERQLKALIDDQARIRANLERLPQTSDAYKRYLKKIDEQETEIEGLQTENKKLQKVEHQQRQEFEAYLSNLNLE